MLQAQDDLRKLDAAVGTREQLLIDPGRRAKFAADRVRSSRWTSRRSRTVIKRGSAELDALMSKVTPQTAVRALEELVGLASSLSGLITELSLVQARARLETVTIEPIQLRSDQASRLPVGNGSIG